MTSVPSGAIAAMSGLPESQHVVTIGNFDGVHRGHNHLLQQVISRAREIGARSLVVTFEPHPIAVLRPEYAPPRISTPDAKVATLHAHGIDDVAVIPFDREFASLAPEEFLEFIVDAACPTDLFVGEGFRFGKMRAGDFAMIERFGAAHEFEAHSVSPLVDDEGVISSSRVRAALLEGHVVTAATLLGRRYRLEGTVEHGMARGRDLGYPTANLDVQPDLCVPQDGIYVGYAHLDEGNHGPREAMIYIGTSPTFGDRERNVEVNILDYRGDLYSQKLVIEFVDFVRGDRLFESPEALMTQMAHDESVSRRILGEAHPEAVLKGD